MKQGRPLRQRSNKQVEREKDFDAARRRVLQRDQYRCQAERFMGVAPRSLLAQFDPDEWNVECERTMHVHHLVGRRVRALYADDDNLITLCAAHHDWVHAHPAAAAAIGLLESAIQMRED